MHQLELQVPEEPKFVALTDAVADPGTVMVVGGHAVITYLAMLCSERLLYMTDGAVFVFYEENDVILILLFFIYFMLLGTVKINLNFNVIILFIFLGNDVFVVYAVRLVMLGFTCYLLCNYLFLVNTLEVERTIDVLVLNSS